MLFTLGLSSAPRAFVASEHLVFIIYTAKYQCQLAVEQI